MRLIGIDFSAAPSRNKPIVAAVWSGGPVVFEAFSSLVEFRAWFFGLTGTIGIDAPFGYPSELSHEVFGTDNWDAVAAELAKIDLDEKLTGLEQRFRAFRDQRPAGLKEPRRETDRDSKSFSSMKMGRPAVGKMAARVIPILRESGFDILPVRRTNSPTRVVEIFPGKWARENFTGQRYKGESGQPEVREAMLTRLAFDLPSGSREWLIGDPACDFLDALIALAQVQEWCESSREIPNTPEGWIL